MIHNMTGGGSAGGGRLPAINVAYPAGSVCTCTNGEKTFTAKDASGFWLFGGLELGLWTVTVTDPTGENKPASKTAEITAESEIVSVELWYRLWLFKSGEGATIPYAAYNQNKSTITVGTNSIDISNNSSVDVGHYDTSYRTDELIDLSKYKTVFISYTASSLYAEYPFGVTTNKFTVGDIQNSIWTAKGTFVPSTDLKTLELDISAINEAMYVGFKIAGSASIYDFWLE